jgi:hypothetical protein
MQQPVQQIVGQREQAAMQVDPLATGGAKRARERGATIAAHSVQRGRLHGSNAARTFDRGSHDGTRQYLTSRLALTAHGCARRFSSSTPSSSPIWMHEPRCQHREPRARCISLAAKPAPILFQSSGPAASQDTTGHSIIAHAIIQRRAL